MICMIKPGIFLASLDIKDVLYSVWIYKEHRKFLQFLVKDKPLQFNAILNGFKDAMLVFNKILKPPFG